MGHPFGCGLMRWEEARPSITSSGFDHYEIPSCRPYGTAGCVGTATPGYATLHPGLFSGSPSGRIVGGTGVLSHVSDARHSPQRRTPVVHPIKERPLVGGPEFAGGPETWDIHFRADLSFAKNNCRSFDSLWSLRMTTRLAKFVVSHPSAIRLRKDGAPIFVRI